MKKLAKILTAAALCVAALTTFGCGDDKKEAAKAPAGDAPIKIAVTAGPHAEIMDNVKKLAEKQGLKIEVVEFNDYVTPNVALFQGEVFANSMQHRPYRFDSCRGDRTEAVFPENQKKPPSTLQKEPKFDLVEVFTTVNFPMAAYSKTLKKGDAIPDGATIGIPNDPSNGGRAILVLANAGLIKVKDIKNVTTTVADITENPHNFKFLELDAATIPRSLPDVTFAVINANYAIPAGLNPTKDSIILESADNPFVNIFVTKKTNENDPRIAKLKEIYQSADNEKFIMEHFQGTILPAWK